MPPMWPGNDKPAPFEDLVEPLARWLRMYINGRNETYDGFPIGDVEAAGSLRAVDALTPGALDYALAHQGRDAYDTIIGIAIQIGIEQGRRRYP